MKAVDAAWVDKLLTGLATFGKTEKGITRLAYTKEDREAQEWLLAQVEPLQLQVSEDAVGNVFLRKPGRNSALAPVTMGSHLDTVIQGGAYDGTVGVVGALAVLDMLREETLERGVQALIFRGEESSRFGFATMGSKLMSGKGDPELFSRAPKKGDCTFKEALAAWGCQPEQYRQAVKQPGCFDSFWELHIEQGKILEQTKTTLGIVHNIAAPTRFKITFTGMADHSGATPMGMRRDALVGGAKLILAVEAAAQAEAALGTVGTVGVIEVEPGSINVIPGQVTLWVDVRGVDGASISRCLEAIRTAAAQIAEAGQLGCSQQLLTADQPVALAQELAALLEKICVEKQITYRHMQSGAGHDAMHMAALAPTCMVFIPCKAGISHNPREYARLEDICQGIGVMAEAVAARAKR